MVPGGSDDCPGQGRRDHFRFGAKSHDAQHPPEYIRVMMMSAGAKRVCMIPGKTIWDPSYADKDEHKVLQPIARHSPSLWVAAGVQQLQALY
eukprot:3486631-Rhodomonas_salina.1